MTNSRASLALLREARKTARQVIVGTVKWLVYELPPAPLDRRQSQSLVFESDYVIRRVRSFPSAWRSLSDADLFVLSWNA